MITITNYKFKDISNFDDFLNQLFIGLAHYEKRNKDFKYKLIYSKDNIELKVIKLNESIN